jgi:hypothetical protein
MYSPTKDHSGGYGNVRPKQASSVQFTSSQPVSVIVFVFYPPKKLIIHHL